MIDYYKKQNTADIISSDSKLKLSDHDFYTEYPDIIGSWDDGYCQRRENKNIENKIEKQFGRIIYKFKILHHAWEADEYAYIVKGEIKNKIISTDHGKAVETNTDYLFNKIKEYEDAIENTKEAIKIFENGKN